MLVCSVVLSLIVGGIATYVATGLRYGDIVEQRADRLAAADGGMRYAVERLTLGASRICATAGGDTIDPPDTNGATVTVICEQVGDGFGDIDGWALILTGEETPSTEPLISTQGGSSTNKLVGGPVYMNRLDFGGSLAPIEFRYSQLLHSGSDGNSDGICDATSTTPAHVSFDSTSLGVACTPRPWSRDAHPRGLYSRAQHRRPADRSEPGAHVRRQLQGVLARPLHDGARTRGLQLLPSGKYILDGFVLDVRHAARHRRTRRRRRRPTVPPNGSPNTTCNAARNADPGIGVTTAGRDVLHAERGQVRTQHARLARDHASQTGQVVRRHPLPRQLADLRRQCDPAGSRQQQGHGRSRADLGTGSSGLVRET